MPVPTYVSSSVENAAPSVINMVYDVSLTNIVPAASAFTVKVNSQIRNVSTIVILGSKVLLKLAKSVAHGDEVMVSYTKPSNNPLQTSSGGIASSFSDKVVNNNCVNKAPVVFITSPSTNSSFTVPAHINITVDASDPDGSVNKVELYSGSVKIGMIDKFPYSFKWNVLSADSYSLTAIATDNDNMKTVSSAISIIVVDNKVKNNQPPLINISSPLKGVKYETNSSITIDAQATDPDGSILKVEFFNGTTKIKELTSPPYEFTMINADPGKYSITAVATDNLDARSVSLPIEFEVGNMYIYDSKSEYIYLYPNPNNGQFWIKFRNPLQSKESNIIITDQSGRQIYKSLILKGETLKYIDIANFKPSIYILNIVNKSLFITKKFIINH